MQWKMGVQFTLPDELHSEHTMDDAVLVYSLYETTYNCTSEVTFEEMVKNLYKPFPGVKERPRSEIKVLEVSNYSLFTKALCRLINDWLAGKIGSGAPTESWEIDAIRHVNKLNGICTGSVDELCADEKAVYDKLLEIKVPGHLRIVTSHRKWINGTLKFLKTIGVRFSEQIDNLVWRHDLSKYSHKEVLGYAIMFGEGRIDFRQLEAEEEKVEWENSLYNHYAHNPHHPEYFYPPQQDGTRTRDRSIAELDPESGLDYLDESTIDMLAANGERLLATEPVIAVKNWFGLADRFFRRYSANDAEYVRAKINKWDQMAKEFLDKDENSEKVNGLFDKRAIVYENTINKQRSH